MPGGYCYLLHPEQVAEWASLGRSDGTRPGARDVAFPSSRSQLGMRAGDDSRRRRRSDGTRPGARDVAFPSSRSQLGMRAGDAEDETRGMDGTNHLGAF